MHLTQTVILLPDVDKEVFKAEPSRSAQSAAGQLRALSNPD